MASIERTAYPRSRHEPNARALQDLFTPNPEEAQFGRTLVRGDEHCFAAIVLLKCLQYLGYFPELAQIPRSIVNHIRVCLRALPGDAPLRSDPHPAAPTNSNPRIPAVETAPQSGSTKELHGRRDSGPFHEHLLDGFVLLAQNQVQFVVPALIQIAQAAVAIYRGVHARRKRDPTIGKNDVKLAQVLLF